MESNKTYFTKVIYSIYMGIIMGFIITSIFLVIMTNVDKYFFNGYIGIRGDWLYYIGTVILTPIFGSLYIYNRRIVINDNKLILREKPMSFIKSEMQILSIKTISLHQQEGRRKIRKGIKFADGNTALMILTKPFNLATISSLLKEILKVNPDIILDDYFQDIIKSN